MEQGARYALLFSLSRSGFGARVRRVYSLARKYGRADSTRRNKASGESGNNIYVYNLPSVNAIFGKIE